MKESDLTTTILPNDDEPPNMMMKLQELQRMSNKNFKDFIMDVYKIAFDIHNFCKLHDGIGFQNKRSQLQQELSQELECHK